MHNWVLKSWTLGSDLSNFSYDFGDKVKADHHEYIGFSYKTLPTSSSDHHRCKINLLEHVQKEAFINCSKRSPVFVGYVSRELAALRISIVFVNVYLCSGEDRASISTTISGSDNKGTSHTERGELCIGSWRHIAKHGL
jgi:hypothetical protein